VRYLTSGLIMLALGLLLGFRITTSPLAVVATFALVMVFAFALCWVFTALAMVVGQPRSVQGLGALVMLPLTFGSNVFVPTNTLPSWLRGFVEINPVTHVAGAADRWSGRGAGDVRADLIGGGVRGVRAAGGVPLPATDLSGPAPRRLGGLRGARSSDRGPGTR